MSQIYLDKSPEKQIRRRWRVRHRAFTRPNTTQMFWEWHCSL